jgi:hypothetical protein
MNEEGPLLESLTRRLAECPPDFLAEPRRQDGPGVVHVGAVASDLLRSLSGAPLNKQQAVTFGYASAQVASSVNRLRLILLACWLLHDEWFRANRRNAGVYELLDKGLNEVAALVDAANFVNDPDRREELSRLCLKGLGLRPRGESVAQARDRLSTLDSVERARVIREAQAAEARAREIREAMAKKAAEEAPPTYGWE